MQKLPLSRGNAPAEKSVIPISAPTAALKPLAVSLQALMSASPPAKCIDFTFRVLTKYFFHCIIHIIIKNAMMGNKACIMFSQRTGVR